MSETAPESDAPLPSPVISPATMPPGEQFIEAGPQIPARMLDETDFGHPRIRRRILLPLALFLATCVTTFMAGVYGWAPTPPDAALPEKIRLFWPQGLIYMAAAIAVLLAHEMGHFLMTVRYRIPASYPIFIPMPILMTTGTMGAVIGMDGLRANRRQLFDIGLAGPLAGLVLTIPLVCIGLTRAEPAMVETYGRPLLVKLLLPYLRPDLAEGALLKENALYMAGWVGMLITGLNMLPVSQLDGGHIIYGLLGRRSRWIARAFLLSAISLIVITENYTWVVMLVLVTLLGTDHPPTANDRVRIGPLRWLIGAASLAIPVLCFTPTPFLIDADRTAAAGHSTPAIAQKMPAPKPSDVSGDVRPTDVVAPAAGPAEEAAGAAAETGWTAGALCGARGCCSGGWTLLAGSLPGRT
jgi:Zn-dependent protease